MDLAALSVPASIVTGARQVASAARDVSIRESELREIGRLVDARLLVGIDAVETAFGSTGVLELDANLIFFETACNFCFWSERPEDRWSVDVGDGAVGGWYGLAACFNRAAQQGVPVYDSAWMATLTVPKAHQLFAGTGQPIPLIEQRVDNVVEAARYLSAQHNGQTLNLLAATDFSAPRIAETVARHLPSFCDGTWYDGNWIWFLKRAQILPSDLSQLGAKYPGFKIANCDQLTAFADYRLPQVLRHFGAFEYSPRLAAVVDTGTILPAGSSGEVEIRACTVQACERLKYHLPGRTSADIDLGLWLISQDLRTDATLLPHHRTPGCFY